MAETLAEAFGFHVKQRVRMLVPCTGCDHEDDEHTIPPGAIGTIDHIDRFDNDQGINITIAIPVPGTNYDRYVVNCFDELDGPPSKFFEDYAGYLERQARELRAFGEKQAAEMDAEPNPRPPTGDDWNDLYSWVLHATSGLPEEPVAPEPARTYGLTVGVGSNDVGIERTSLDDIKHELKARIDQLTESEVENGVRVWISVEERADG